MTDEEKERMLRSVGWWMKNNNQWMHSFWPEIGWSLDVAYSMEKYRRHLDGELGATPMRLNCPECGELHVDEGEFATKPHHTHACQACGAVWRPAVVCTVGVRFLPGFKSEVK